MKSDKLLVDHAGAVAWVTFNNPARHNAVSVEMWQVLAAELATLAADPGVHVLVLRGAGEEAFVSGADISEFESRRSRLEDVDAYNVLSETVSQKLLNFPKPTVAMIHGYCIGGGLGIACACDIRLAAQGASFAVPAAKLGVGYRYTALKRLVELVGPAVAADLFYSARRIDAGEAASIGLVNRVVPKAELHAHVTSYAERIAGNAPLSITSAKRAFIEMFKDDSSRDLAACRVLEAACATSEDYVEGRKAFAERRAPQFRGR